MPQQPVSSTVTSGPAPARNDGGRSAGADQGLLVTMAVQHTLPGRAAAARARAAPACTLFRQPAVGEVDGSRDCRSRPRHQVGPLVGQRQQTARLQTQDRRSVGHSLRQAGHLRRGPDRARRRETLANHRPAATGESAQVRPHSRLVSSTRTAARPTCRLVVGGEAIVKQDARGHAVPAFGSGLVPAKPAAEMVGVQRRQDCGGDRCRSIISRSQRNSRLRLSQFTTGANGAASRFSKWHVGHQADGRAAAGVAGSIACRNSALSLATSTLLGHSALQALHIRHRSKTS